MSGVRPILQRSWSCYFTQEWTEWFRKGFNWRNFHLIEISYEDECHMGQREVRVFLLGFGCTIQWCYDEAAHGLALVQDRMAEIMTHPEAAIPLETALEQIKARRSSSAKVTHDE